MREACYEPGADRIANACEDNGDYGGGVFGGVGRASNREDDIYIDPNQFRRKSRQLIQPIGLDCSVLEDQVLSLDIAEITKALSENSRSRYPRDWRWEENANPIHPLELLRLDGARRGEDGSKASHKCAAVHSGRDASARSAREQELEAQALTTSTGMRNRGSKL